MNAAVVRVSLFDGRCVTLDLQRRPSMTVRSAKREVQTLAGWGSPCMRLVFAGIELDESDNPLRQYGVASGTVLHAFPSLEAVVAERTFERLDKLKPATGSLFDSASSSSDDEGLLVAATSSHRSSASGGNGGGRRGGGLVDTDDSESSSSGVNPALKQAHGGGSDAMIGPGVAGGGAKSDIFSFSSDTVGNAATAGTCESVQAPPRANGRAVRKNSLFDDSSEDEWPPRNPGAMILNLERAADEFGLPEPTLDGTACADVACATSLFESSSDDIGSGERGSSNRRNAHCRGAKCDNVSVGSAAVGNATTAVTCGVRESVQAPQRSNGGAVRKTSLFDDSSEDEWPPRNPDAMILNLERAADKFGLPEPALCGTDCADVACATSLFECSSDDIGSGERGSSNRRNAHCRGAKYDNVSVGSAAVGNATTAVTCGVRESVQAPQRSNGGAVRKTSLFDDSSEDEWPPRNPDAMILNLERAADEFGLPEPALCGTNCADVACATSLFESSSDDIGSSEPAERGSSSRRNAHLAQFWFDSSSDEDLGAACAPTRQSHGLFVTGKVDNSKVDNSQKLAAVRTTQQAPIGVEHRRRLLLGVDFRDIEVRGLFGSGCNGVVLDCMVHGVPVALKIMFVGDSLTISHVLSSALRRQTDESI